MLGGEDPAAPAEHLEAAGSLGRLLAGHGVTLLDDGETAGSRGVLASAFKQAGGHVSTSSSSDSARHADGFIALPGGSERLEQLLQAGSEGAAAARPCGLLNTGDFFTTLLGSEADAVLERFVQETQRGRVIVDRDPARLLQAMLEFRPPETRRQSP